VYDEFVIETELMDICDRLTRRMLDGQWQSGTVALKIRYSDFSTESAQETSARPVGTMNDLFDRARSLFHRKYKRGYGVRLIGAGLMNLEPRAPSAGELFDFDGTKKIALESCIHEINRKFPQAAIKRARLI
jgi:DNA polymerase-4